MRYNYKNVRVFVMRDTTIRRPERKYLRQGLSEQMPGLFIFVTQIIGDYSTTTVCTLIGQSNFLVTFYF